MRIGGRRGSRPLVHGGPRGPRCRRARLRSPAIRVTVWSNSSASGVSRVIVTSVVAGAPCRGAARHRAGRGLPPRRRGRGRGRSTAGPPAPAGRPGPDRSCVGVAAISRSANNAAFDGEVGGFPGDQPGPPHRDLTGQHPLPESRQPVGQLEGVGDQLPGGVVGDPERGGQVDGGELRDPRRTRSGERDQALVVQVGLAPVRGCLVGRAGVQPRPLQGQLELLDGCLLLGLAGGADTVDHLGGGEGGCRGHGSILGGRTDSFEKLFDTVDRDSKRVWPQPQRSSAVT